jgi:hypothetical protein
MRRRGPPHDQHRRECFPTLEEMPYGRLPSPRALFFTAPPGRTDVVQVDEACTTAKRRESAPVTGRPGLGLPAATGAREEDEQAQREHPAQRRSHDPGAAQPRSSGRERDPAPRRRGCADTPRMLFKTADRRVRYRRRTIGSPQASARA